ncbi:MAG: Helicase PriA essential for oriC/DnaA-independent DNA replication, partial [uncultured Phycisphaerae bacterium]
GPRAGRRRRPLGGVRAGAGPRHHRRRRGARGQLQAGPG